MDLTRLLPGPLATLLLADLGAEVIKVEDPQAGDPLRPVPPLLDGVSVMFHCLNRGKRFVSLDLRNPADHDRFLGLLGTADGLIEGFRPDVLPRLGLDPQDLVARFPGLVIGRVSWFGTGGPWALRPGHDLNFLGLSGVMDGVAGPLPIQAADVGVALLAVSGFMATLLGRQRGLSVDRILDIPILDAALLMALPPHARQAAGDDPAPGRGLLEGGLPVYRMYEDRDGRTASVAAIEPRFAEALRDRLGGTDEDTLRTAFSRASRADLTSGEDRLPCVEPVLSLPEARRHPAVVARRLFRTVSTGDGVFDLPVTPFTPPSAGVEWPWAGQPGRDNDVILS